MARQFFSVLYDGAARLALTHRGSEVNIRLVKKYRDAGGNPGEEISHLGVRNGGAGGVIGRAEEDSAGILRERGGHAL